VLAADVVGYSRLMAADEAGTLARLKARHAALIEPKSAEYKGRIVKLIGDGTLMEFRSVVDAVNFAVAVQRESARDNAGEPEDRRIVYRIGINIGDIIVDGDDIYGDGVNIAARLEGLADPGGICVSGTVHGHVKGKVAVGFENLGAREVKNIPEPVRVYKVLLDAGAAQPAAPTARAAKARRRRAPVAAGVAAAVAVAAIVAAILLWQRPWAPREEPASVERMALPLPDKPSIAVLPFANLSGDPEQDYFADGITDDLITDLSKISGLFVIARNSVFAYKGRTVEPREIAEALGVRYLLQGSVRRAGNQVRVNTQLIDATTGGHMWAERFDHALDDIFALQDSITGKVVEALSLRLTATDRTRRATEAKTDSVEAYDMVLQARKLLTRFDSTAADQARDLLERAIAVDADYAEAYSLLGLYYFDAYRLWGESRDANLARALELARGGVRLSPTDPAPHVLLAQIHQFRREFAAANTEADAALALGPNDAVTLANLGSMLRYAHRPGEAAKVIERAIRLDPYHPPNYLEWLGDAYFLLDRPQDCIDRIERGIALEPDFVALHVAAVKCYGAIGDEEKARRAAAEILRISPGFTVTAFAAYVPFTDPGDLQRNVDMLRRAGVPE